jgi:vitamin B12 transporter
MNGRSALLLGLLALPSSLTAQIARDSARLAEIVVTARRDSTHSRRQTAAADLVSAEERRRRGLDRLSDALGILPGAAVVATGAPGGVASTFFRGVNSSHTLLLIDGIRVHDANTPAAALFGGLELEPNDQLEVVRGPQGTLYGGAAIGGVVSIGQGEPPVSPTWSGDAVVGSFASYGGRISGSTRTAGGRLAIAGSIGLAETDHQRPFNQNDRRSQSLQVRYRGSPRIGFGATVRALQSSYRSPGDIRTTNSTPETTTDFDHHLATVFVETRVAGRWSNRLTLGGQGHFLRGTSRFDGSDPFLSRLKATRWVADWQHRVLLGRQWTAVGGVDLEWSEVTDEGLGRDERSRAAYADLTFSPIPDATLTAGLRRDDYSSFGGRTTGRLAAGYFVAARRLKLRGTYGSGFLPPSLAARFGGPFQRPNPAIRPETSTGWDVGIDHFFARDRAVVSATVFGNELRDLIGFESAPFPELGSAINVDRARTRGLELSGRVVIDRVDFRTGYTYLEANDLGATDPAERRLIRRPRHALTADLAWQGNRLDLALGARAALDREDTDFNAFPFRRVDPGNVVDTRVMVSWRANGRMVIRGRIENLFDARYEEVWGFPALGRRASIGLTLTTENR